MQLERYNVALYWIPIAGVILVMVLYLVLSQIPSLAGERRRSFTLWILCGFYLLLIMPVVRLSYLIEARNQVCFNNLEILDQAKENWALENVKAPSDIPTEVDLFGIQDFIEANLHCPLGGKYSINSIKEAPNCTVPEHNRMFKPF